MRIHFFRNGRKKTEIIDGYRFDSKGEIERYGQLKIKLNVGQIQDLQVHPAYVVIEVFIDASGKKHPQTKFTPDFQYYQDGKLIVEDVKPVMTYYTKKNRIKKRKFLVNETYNIRKKLFLKNCLTKNMIFIEVEA